MGIRSAETNLPTSEVSQNPKIVEAKVPNEKIDVSGPLEISGGDNIISFNELEAVESYEKSKTRREAKKEAEKQKLMQKELKGSEKAGSNKNKKAAKGTEDAEDGDTGEAEELEAASDDQSSETDKEDLDQVEAKAKEKLDEKKKDNKSKKIKVKAGEEEFELSYESLVPVTIQGETQEVPLDELRSHYAGKVNWDKKMGELNYEKQTFTNAKQKLDSELNEIFTIAQKDPLQAFFTLAQRSGIDPVKLQVNFMNNAGQALENWKSMSDNEKRLFEVELQNKLLTTQAESEKQRQESEQSLRALSQKVETLRETHQIKPDEFANAFERLIELQSQGQIKREITADFVAEVIVWERNYNALESGLVSLKLDPQKQEQVINEMLDLATRNPDLSPADLVDIAKEVYGSKRAQNLSNKIAKSKGIETVRKSAPVEPDREPLFFEDL